MASSRDSLSSFGISSGTSNLLKSMWITTPEEFVASISALRNAAGNEAARNVAGKLGMTPKEIDSKARKLSDDRLTTPSRGGAFGCHVPDSARENFTKFGRVHPRTSRPTSAFAGRYPSSVRLFDRFPAVRDQGGRGTCVGFGTVALREYLIDFREELSEQFMYWACKEIDGSPGPGTYLSTAQVALDEFGICEEYIWPYNPMQEDDEGQGPPPDGAITNAQDYRLSGTRNVQPDLISNYKNILAGNDTEEPLPITFGTLVFGSWLDSPETNRTGKITMPYPDEGYLGGHAWCVVGYVDNPDVPGGGYLIVRNSWGDSWACESPEAPGYAMMPYAYAKEYAIEAFTGPRFSGTGKGRSENRSTYLRKLTSEASKDRREFDTGKTLKLGSTVICHPKYPDVFKEYNESNWRRFEKRGYFWDSHNLTEELKFGDRDSLDSNIGACSNFTDSISNNVSNIVGMEVPYALRSLWQKVFLLNPRFRSYHELVDLKKSFLGKVYSNMNLSAGELPSSVQRSFEQSTAFKVYRIKSSGVKLDVIGVYHTPKIRQGEVLTSVPLVRAHIEQIKEQYDEYLRKADAEKPDFVLLTIGTAEKVSGSLDLVKSADSLIVVSEPSDEMWTTHTPRGFEDCPSMRQLISLAQPITREEILSQVKAVVDDELLLMGHGGVKLSSVARKTGLRKSQVRDAFLTLQKNDDYGLYRRSAGDKELSIAKAVNVKERNAVKASDFRKSWWGRNFATVVLPTLSALAGILIMFLTEERLAAIIAFAATVPLTYVGALISRILRIRLDPDS